MILLISTVTIIVIMTITEIRITITKKTIMSLQINIKETNRIESIIKPEPYNMTCREK